jgi:hypothetical protein
MVAWLAPHTAEPSLDDQVPALSADMQRWIRRQQQPMQREAVGGS